MPSILMVDVLCGMNDAGDQSTDIDVKKVRYEQDNSCP
jgi:hypothetical protein